MTAKVLPWPDLPAIEMPWPMEVWSRRVVMGKESISVARPTPEMATPSFILPMRGNLSRAQRHNTTIRFYKFTIVHPVTPQKRENP